MRFGSIGINRRASLFGTVAAVAALACQSDRSTSPLATSGASRAIAAPTRKAPRLSIVSVVPSSTTFTIEGPSVNYDVTISNPGSTNATGVLIQAEIDQGSAARAAGGAVTSCPGAGAGVVPPGQCTMTMSANASNAGAGNGTLTPGNAKLVIQLYQSDGTTTLLDTKTLKIVLVASAHTAPYFTDVSPSFTSLQIDGPSADYSVTINNPTGADQSEIFIQAEIVQGQTLKGAGGTDVLCFPNGASPGLLPAGNCTFTSSTLASNSAGGNGTLVAGSAVWRLTLYKYDSSTNTTTTLDVREISITLTGP